MIRAKLILLLSALAMVTLSPCRAQRVGLVIGNNAYQHAGVVKSPVPNAVDVTDALGRGGFATQKLTDGNRDQMKTSLDALVGRAQGAELCLFYFCGHGIEVGGQNYLVPTDGILRNEADLRTQMISLSFVLETLQRTNARRKVVVLDCCRSNPFNQNLGGLAAVADEQFPLGTLIVYSGSPGKTVPDGRGRNTDFTAELIQQMRPGRDILSLFGGVAAARFKTQDPWIKFSGRGSTFADLRNYNLLADGGEVAPVRNAEIRLRIASYWNHNGSTMGLLVDGKRRIMIYVKVREGLQGHVEPGMVLFHGWADGETYAGKARRFSPGLPPIEYDAAGPILEGGNSVVLAGKAPIRNPDGSIKKVIDDRLEFTYLRLPE